MDMTGEERIPASREAVWAALNNPNVLKKCIPGCESMEKKSPTEMVATIKLKVGPISTSLKGNISLTNLKPAESYTINWEGQGGLAGSAKGSSDVELRQDGNETILTYEIKAQLGGKLALLGSKLIGSRSKKLAEQFFHKLNKIIAKKAEAASEA